MTCVHVHARVHTCTCMHTYVHMHTYTRMCTEILSVTNLVVSSERFVTPEARRQLRADFEFFLPLSLKGVNISRVRL